MPRRGLGWPLWVDAAEFDLDDHVRVFPLPVPDETQLLRTTERLYRHQLNRSRRLWEMWLLPGLPQGRVGLFMKVHHTIADGVAGVAVLGRFLDTGSDALAAPIRPWRPAFPPSPRELFADNVRRRVGRAQPGLLGIGPAGDHPASRAALLAVGAGGLRREAGSPIQPQPSDRSGPHLSA